MWLAGAQALGLAFLGSVAEVDSWNTHSDLGCHSNLIHSTGPLDEL